MNKINKSVRYLELDALRGIAALMVVSFHITMHRPEADFGFKLGSTGVELFFIISGFVIFMSLNNISNSTDFIINRISRLYPTYWASVTITFLLKSIWSVYINRSFESIPWIIYVGNMTMFQFYMNIPNLDDPYWTMIIEMIFYIGILLLYHFSLLKYLDGIGLFLSISIVFISQFWKDHNWAKEIIYWVPLFEYLPLFWAGTVFYKIYKKGQNLIKLYVIVSICFVCQILISESTGRSNFFITTPEYILMLSLFFLAFILFVNNGLKFIVNKVTLFFGKISFALYLTHQYVSLFLIIPLLTKVLKFNYWLISFGFALPIVVLVASFITFYIEVPLGRRMKDKLRRLKLSF